MTMFRPTLALISALALASCGNPSEGVTDELVIKAPAEEWLSYGRDYSEQRYSPLTGITDGNVAKLGLAWYADLDTARPQQATPLVHDGMIFISTAWSMVKAFDARSGALKWSFDPEVPRETLVKACCDAVNRGVAINGDKLFIGTLDGRLIALDRKTGKQVWSTVTVDQSKPYTITGAPRAFKGMVLIGNGGAEMGVRGYVTAYDAESGKQIWRFYTVPDKPGSNKEAYLQKAEATWKGEWWKQGGGGTVWDAMAYDPELDLLYIGVGNGSPWNQAVRSPGGGDNLYLSSIVAIKATTGEYAWHFQSTPGETWDYTATQHIILADLKINGIVRKVLVQAPKNGFFYVIDRTNGKFISAKNYIDVNWATGIDPKSGRPIENPEARYDRTNRSFVAMPGSIGGHNWQPMSFSPKTGLVYIPIQRVPGAYASEQGWKRTAIGPQLGVETKSMADRVPQPASGESLPPLGALIAWDPVRQVQVWVAERPFVGNGGTMATAGNLVFQGTIDGQFEAFSADKGKRLWSFDTRSGVVAAPSTYALDGEHYVAILTGLSFWGVPPGMNGKIGTASRLLVFKLGGKAALPPTNAQGVRSLDPPTYTGTVAQYAQGARLFGRYCVACHGPGGISSGTNPDLRHSATLNDGNAFRIILIDGVLSQAGMVSFKSVLSDKDAEAIRQYLIKRANEDRTAQQKRSNPVS
jgi:quinohemoprotein ethanol dehydrogenase